MCTPLSSMFKQLPKPVSVDGITPCKREYLSSVMDICTHEMVSLPAKSEIFRNSCIMATHRLNSAN